MANDNLNTSQTWEEMLEADQSLMDLMTKYPEVTTEVPDYLQNELDRVKKENNTLWNDVAQLKQDMES